MDMYQKREERAKKKLENNNEKVFPKTQINWDISIYGNTCKNPCKIKIS